MNVIYHNTIEIGKLDYDDCGKKNYTATVEVELREKNKGISLSIMGNIFKTNNPANVGCCGQCLDTIYNYFPNNAKMKRIKEVWERWHLNDFHAGCEHQRAFEKEPYENHRGAYCEICDYVYGTDWKFEELPQKIIEEVKSW